MAPSESSEHHGKIVSPTVRRGSDGCARGPRGLQQLHPERNLLGNDRSDQRRHHLGNDRGHQRHRGVLWIIQQRHDFGELDGVGHDDRRYARRRLRM
jgi:hypothetical protein